VSGLSPRGATVVVTGASAGIGAATALAFAQRGANVVGVARRADRLADAIGACERAGARALAVAGDVAVVGDAERVLAAAQEAFGPVDVVVNNAGIGLHKNAADTTVEEIERVFAVNFFGAVRMTMAALPGMLERRRGSIVNVTSVAGYLPNPNESGYGATKAALSLWSHGLGVDLAGRGVHVGVLSPGPIDTEIWGLDGSGATYSGKLYPPSVVAEAAVEMVEKGIVHRTAPRAYGAVGAVYPLVGRPMRWGLRRYAAAERRKHP
jgi:short-subunit dehydrogenase